MMFIIERRGDTLCLYGLYGVSLLYSSKYGGYGSSDSQTMLETLWCIFHTAMIEGEGVKLKY